MRSPTKKTNVQTFGSMRYAPGSARPKSVAATAAAVSAVTTVNASALSTTLGDSVTANKSDIVEMVQRIQRYLHAAGPCTQIPIGEAMVNYKDEDSRQIFVPFVSVSISKHVYMKLMLIDKLLAYTGCANWLFGGPTSLTRSRRERHASWRQYWRATVAEYVQRHTHWKLQCHAFIWGRWRGWGQQRTIWFATPER